MSAVWASYRIEVKNKRNCKDAKMAQKIFDYCKEHFDWFLEWGEGPFGIKGNVISTDPAFKEFDGFDLKNAGGLFEDPIGWLKAACDECKPGQLNVSVFVDADETGAMYPYRKIEAILKDGELRTTTDLEYCMVPDLESGMFSGCEELENFQAGFAPDSFGDILVVKNCSTLEVGEVLLVFKTKDGEETTEPIRINPGSCDDVYESLVCGNYYLEQGRDTTLMDAGGHRVCRLSDINIKNVLENEKEAYPDETAEFLGLFLPGLKKPIMLNAWKKSKKKKTSPKKFQKKQSAGIVFGTFTDPRDGQVYKTVKIGDQEWLAENLHYKCDGSFAYDDDESNVETYGRLYSWDAAMKYAPAGWHLPTNDEFAELESMVKNITDSEVGAALKSTDDWADSDFTPAGSDEFGFAALPAGEREIDGSFDGLSYDAYFWTTTKDEDCEEYVYMRRLNCDFGDFMEVFGDKDQAISVRLLRG